VLWSAGFALFLVVVVGVWYFLPRRERCPQCHALRDPESPLCRECGWIWDASGDEDDDLDYGEAESVEPWN